VPLNPALKGKEYGAVTFLVERDRVVQFAEAVAEDAAVFRDPRSAAAAGHEEQLAPPTFATVLQVMASAQIAPDPSLGLNYMLVVHGEQEFEWRRPIRVGDRLRAVPRIADIYARGPNEFLVVEADIQDEAGQTVVMSRSTLLSRGTAGTRTR
jgi:acyl dehydratase